MTSTYKIKTNHKSWSTPNHVLIFQILPNVNLKKGWTNSKNVENCRHSVNQIKNQVDT
jgi:hypothetical protein